MEVPPKVGRWFGLLTDCDHAFCLDCIRSWRQAQLTKEVVRSCPLCRVVLGYTVLYSIHTVTGISLGRLSLENHIANQSKLVPVNMKVFHMI